MMATMKPSVVVVIPAHNAANTVARAVRSAWSQDVPPDEVYVVDDGSSDDTAERARAAGAQVLRLPACRGAAVARHEGATASKADLICFLDADDEYAPGFLVGVTRIWQLKPHAVLLVGRSEEHHDDGRIRRPLGLDADDCARPVAALAWHNRIPTSATAVPRNAYVTSGGFRHLMGGASSEDYDLWLRLAFLGPFAVAGDAWVRRYVSSTSHSRRRESQDFMLQSGLAVVRRHREQAQRHYPPFARVATAHVYREAARRALASGDPQRAAELLSLALWSNPADGDAWALRALAAFPSFAQQHLLHARRMLNL